MHVWWKKGFAVLRTSVLRNHFQLLAGFCTPLRAPEGLFENTPAEVVYIKNEHYSYLQGTHLSNSDRSVYTVHHRPTANSLEQFAAGEALKENDQKAINNNLREDVQLRTRFQYHWQCLLQRLTELKTMSDGLLSCINISTNQSDQVKEEVRPVHFALYRVRRTVRQFTAAKISQTLAENFIQSTTTNCAESILLDLNKACSLELNVNIRRFNGATIRNPYSFPHIDECIKTLG